MVGSKGSALADWRLFLLKPAWTFSPLPSLVCHASPWRHTQFSSVTQLCLTLCNPIDCMQHTRPPCPSPIPRAYSNSCPLNPWCHPTISSSVILFSISFNHCQHQGLFKCVSSLHQVAKVLEFQLQPSVLLMIIQDCFPLGWTGWISLLTDTLTAC